MIYRNIGLVLAGISLYSGWQHLKNPYYFLGTVYSYDLLSPTLGYWVAALVPISQVILSAMVFARFCELVSSFLLVVMLSTFALAQTFALAKGLTIPCGCFGADSELQVGWPSVAWVYTMVLGSGYYARSCIIEYRGQATINLEQQ